MLTHQHTHAQSKEFGKEKAHTGPLKHSSEAIKQGFLHSCPILTVQRCCSSLGPRASELAAGLYYDAAELADLPPEAAGAGAGPLLAYLAGCHASLAGGRLDLAGRGLAAVPRHVGGMAHLTELQLGRNPIAELPE